MPKTKRSVQAHAIALELYCDRLETTMKKLLEFVPRGNDARLAEDYDEHPMRTAVAEVLKTRPT